MQRWKADNGSEDSLESWKDVCLRVKTGIEQLCTENENGKRIAVVTSGGPIAAIMQIALDLDDKYAFNLPRFIRNTSVSTFIYDKKRLSLLSYNSVAHLELHEDPTLITFI